MCQLDRFIDKYCTYYKALYKCSVYLNDKAMETYVKMCDV